MTSGLICKECGGPREKGRRLCRSCNLERLKALAKDLLTLSRTRHSRLHRYLDIQRVIIEKSVNENSENCWEALIVPMTTAWLATTSAKVQKLSEIG
jgi:hypothetical protein